MPASGSQSDSSPLMVRLLTTIKRPLSASLSADPSPQPLRSFGRFSASVDDPATKPSSAAREDPRPFANGSLDAARPTQMEPDGWWESSGTTALAPSDNCFTILLHQCPMSSSGNTVSINRAMHAGGRLNTVGGRLVSK